MTIGTASLRSARTTVAAVVLATALAPIATAQRAQPDHDVPYPEPGNAYGTSVDVHGDDMVVGAPLTDSLVMDSGAAQVYLRASDGSWSETDLLAPANLADGDRFGAGVAVEGDTLLIGAPGDSQWTTRSGAVYVFERQGDGSWLQVDVLRPADANSDDRFGDRIAIDGDRAVIAANKSSSFTAGYAAYVYERTAPGAPWMEAAKLVNSDHATFDGFGTSLAIDGDRIVVGAPNPLGSAPGLGAAYLFVRRSDGTWLEAQRFDPGPVALTGFGEAVQITDDVVAVSGRRVGHVQVFGETAPNVWALLDELFPIGPAASYFGDSIAMDAERIAVSQTGTAFHPNVPGLVHVFERAPDDTWSPSVVMGQTNGVVGDLFAHQIVMDEGRVIGTKLGTGPNPGVSDFRLGTLYHGDRTVSASAGGEQELLLRAGPTRAGHVYLLTGSASGTTPVLGDPFFDLGAPLIADAYTNVLLVQAGAGLVAPWIGVLDGNGAADAEFAIPSATDPAFVGTVLHHGYLAFDPLTFGVSLASDSVQVELAL